MSVVTPKSINLVRSDCATSNDGIAFAVAIVPCLIAARNSVSAKEITNSDTVLSLSPNVSDKMAVTRETKFRACSFSTAVSGFFSVFPMLL